MAYSVTLIAEVKTNDRRRIVFLECPSDKSVNAKKAFEKLKENRRRDLRGRFDHWIDGQQHFTKYHHGFDAPKYKDCYVFKIKAGGSHHRFYGFLVHPMPVRAPRFQLCVLASHAVKNTEETDPSELNWVLELRCKQEVADAIKRTFPDGGESYADRRPLDRWKQ